MKTKTRQIFGTDYVCCAECGRPVPRVRSAKDNWIYVGNSLLLLIGAIVMSVGILIAMRYMHPL